MYSILKILYKSRIFFPKFLNVSNGSKIHNNVLVNKCVFFHCLIIKSSGHQLDYKKNCNVQSLSNQRNRITHNVSAKLYKILDILHHYSNLRIYEIFSE